MRLHNDALKNRGFDVWVCTEKQKKTGKYTNNKKEGNIPYTICRDPHKFQLYF